MVLGARTPPIFSPFRSYFLPPPRTGDPTTNFPLYNSKPGAHTGAVKGTTRELASRASVTDAARQAFYKELQISGRNARPGVGEFGGSWGDRSGFAAPTCPSGHVT